MSSPPEPDDVDALRSRDRAAWSATYDRYVQSTFAFIAHLVDGDRRLAEELHQELWLTAMSAVDQFAPDRGEFRGWLFGIARKRVAMHYRAATGRPIVDLGQDASMNSEMTLPDDVLEQVEREQAVRAALAELSHDAREVLVSKYVDARSVADIAERVGKSTKAVESLLSRSRERLRDVLRWYFPRPAPQSVSSQQSPAVTGESS